MTMGGPTTWTINRASGLPTGPKAATLAAALLPRVATTDDRPRGPVSPGGAILADRERLEGQVAQLRAALADLLAISQVQILLTPEREEILEQAQRTLEATKEKPHA